MKKLAVIILLLLGITEAEGQGTPCAFDRIRAYNPFYNSSVDFFSQGLAQWRLTGQIPREYPNPEVPYQCYNCLVINPTITQAKFVIPIVIHIVHLPSDSIIGMGSNISTDQINDQINRLNEYFSNKNGSSKSVNTGIQFCLAPVGPNNDGIIRYSSNKSNHEIDNNKYLEFLALNTTLAHDRFLHIFTCNNILGDTSLRGYSSALDDKYQGVVIEYNLFGKFNPNNSNINVITGSEGKMLVHEVGHFLGLEHTFFGGCGQDTADCHKQGDRCCDTPPVASLNTNCSSGRNSCNELYQNDLPDQTENYMDYAEDACKNTFTRDQTQIMHYVLLNKRTNLIDPRHINNLNLPCATFSAFFRPGSNTACQNDTISFIALRYSDTVNAIYTWEVIRNNIPVLTLLDTNLYSFRVGLDSVGIYKVKLTVSKSGSTVSETLNDAVVSQNCGTPKASTQGNWYFGKNAGIQFTNTNQVVSSSKAFYADPNPTIDSDEGCITQSAKNGRLLFYGGGKTEFGTNGIALYDTFYVYDKTHKLMPNGALKGSSSSTQGGVVIPHPENGSRFYLLTTNQVSSNSNFDEYDRGLRWNLIDTSLNNGNGDIVPGYKNMAVRVPNGVEKVNIHDSAVYTGEGVAAIPHCDGKRYWLITGSGDDFGSKWVHVFISDTNGIMYDHSDSMPILRYTYHTTSASPDGNFVSISGNLFSFDRVSGRLGFLKNLDSTNLTANYSEFSPNSSVLYTVLLYADTIFIPFMRQTDLRSSALNSTIFPLDFSNRMPQLGPDGKIYIAQYDEGFLSVIDYPDSVNTLTKPNACGYRKNAVSLNPNSTDMRAKIGLPNMVDALSPTEVDNNISIMASSCLSYTFRPVINCSDFYIWDFGDGDTAHGYTVNHSYDSKDEYTVTLYTEQDTVTITIKVGMHLSTPTIAGPEIICDTTNRKNYSAIVPNNNFLDSVSTLKWIPYQGNIIGQSNKTSTEVKWHDEGRLTLLYQDRFGCYDSIWIDVDFADSGIYNNTITKSDTIFCDSSELVTIAGSTPLGGSGQYEFYWFKSVSSSGPWFLVKGEYDDSLIEALPGFYYFRKVISDGCEHISNIISPSKRFITNNIIFESRMGCATSKLNGSSPSSPIGSYRYRWFIDGGSGFEINEEDTLSDFIPYISKSEISYYRQVMSGTCITNSNVVKVVNFDLNNYIAKIIPPNYQCTPKIWGTDLSVRFPNVKYKWESSIDNVNWTELTNDTLQEFEQSITDTIIRYYRRMALDSNCVSFSNVIENKAVRIIVPINQYNSCSDSLFPLVLKYEFDKPSYIGNLTIIWQVRKAGPLTVWKETTDGNFNDTQSRLDETVDLVGGGTLTLQVGDTLRMRYIYVCGINTYSFLSEKHIIYSEDALSIFTHPRDTTISAGNKAFFSVEVNDPNICAFLWQYSKTNTGGWFDLPNSNNDTFITGLTGGCNDSLYYRVKIFHPCGIGFSNAAKLKINFNSPAFDYWLKDQWTDSGIEINLDSNEVVRSPDIWVRYFKDGIKRHQTPTNTLDTNWVYATIRNRGTQPIKGAKVYFYWSWGSTGEWWGESWKESTNNSYFNLSTHKSHPMGGEINKEGLEIDSIMPGDSLRIMVPWTNIPELNWYDLTKTFWRDRINVCFLARIQTCEADPFGITYKEGINVRRNAYQNNNIAVKNAFVVHLYPTPINPFGTDQKDLSGGGYGEQLTLRNNAVSGGTIRVWNKSGSDFIKLCINLKQSAFNAKANAYIEFGESIHTAWMEGGASSTGIVHVTDRIYRLTGTSACLTNIIAVAGFQDNIRLLFAYKDLNNRFSGGERYDFTIQQFDSVNNVVGECLFEIKDNAFTSSVTTLTFTDSRNACDFDGSGGYLKYIVPCPDIEYTIWDENNDEYLPISFNGEYYLLPGEYLITCNDILNAQIKKTTLTVGSSIPTTVNTIDTIWYDCEYPDSIDYVKTCGNGVMYDRFNQEVSESKPGHYTLDPQETWYTFVCADSANCITYSTQIQFKDIIQVPASTSNYLTGIYNRKEHPCCFIDLTEVECDGDTPLTFGQEIQVYDMNADFLYQTNLELYGGTVLGFRFCPPQWDTSANVISNWYSIVIRNDQCSFCRMDFMCDSLSDPEPFIILNNPSGQSNDNQGNINQISKLGGITIPAEKPGKLPTSISIYPNPTSSEVNIKVIRPRSEFLTVQINDASGKSIYSGNYETTNNSMIAKIDLTNFTCGIYTLYIPELGYYYKLVIIR